MTVELYQSGQSVEQLADVLKMKKNGPYKRRKWYPKKSIIYIRSKVSTNDFFDFIYLNSNAHDIKLMCRVLKVARSSYYSWINRKSSKWEKQSAHLSRLIPWK